MADNDKPYNDLVGGTIESADSIEIVIVAPDGIRYTLEPYGDPWGWYGFLLTKTPETPATYQTE